MQLKTSPALRAAPEQDPSRAATKGNDLRVTAQHLFRARGSGLVDLFFDSGEEYRFSFTDPYPAVIVLRALPLSERHANSGMATEYTFHAERPVEDGLANRLKTLASGRIPRGGPDHRRGIQEEEDSST